MWGLCLRSAVRIQWHLQCICCHQGTAAASLPLAGVTASGWNIIFPARCHKLPNEQYTGKKWKNHKNINKNKRIGGLMTRYIFLVSGRVKTVSLDEIKKKMGDKTRISEVWFVWHWCCGWACNALICTRYAHGSCTFENKTLLLRA